MSSMACSKRTLTLWSLFDFAFPRELEKRLLNETCCSLTSNEFSFLIFWRDHHSPPPDELQPREEEHDLLDRLGCDRPLGFQLRRWPRLRWPQSERLRSRLYATVITIEKNVPADTSLGFRFSRKITNKITRHKKSWSVLGQKSSINLFCRKEQSFKS